MIEKGKGRYLFIETEFKGKFIRKAAAIVDCLVKYFMMELKGPGTSSCKCVVRVIYIISCFHRELLKLKMECIVVPGRVHWLHTSHIVMCRVVIYPTQPVQSSGWPTQ